MEQVRDILEFFRRVRKEFSALIPSKDRDMKGTQTRMIHFSFIIKKDLQVSYL